MTAHITTEEHHETIEAGASFEVDSSQVLHIQDENGRPIAAYNKWESVRIEEPQSINSESPSMNHHDQALGCIEVLAGPFHPAS
ncbi:hypothetical protein [Bifidobacterium psychraerophilum]|uniref:hypothetical protein n=1 Tax=Bifidobacterium psychraerophilum TaxID=218140 RepID=UPI0039E7D20F